MTIYNSPGTNQLGESFGTPKPGDVIQFHIVGNVISNEPKPFCYFCMGDYNQFIDTTHMSKRATIEIGRKDYDGLYRGLHEALKEMKFGDECIYFIPSELAFGKQGLSMSTIDNPKPDHVDRNPVPVSYKQIKPDTGLEVTIVFFRLCRDGKWHNRKPRNKPNVLNSAYASHM